MVRGAFLLLFSLVLLSCQTTRKTASTPPSFEELLAAAQKGDLASQRQVGEAYLGGYGTAMNVQRGCEWLDKAARAGDGKAAVRLAEMYRAFGNLERAVVYLEMGAAAGEAEASYQLGLYHLNGLMFDWSKAKAHLEKASAAGHTQAAYVLARYETSAALEQTLESHAAGNKNIAMLLAHERATAELHEREMIVRQLRSQAERGDAGSQFLLGEMLAETAKDRWGFLEACRWYTTCAERGVPEAQSRKDELLEQIPPEEAKFVVSQLAAMR